MRVDKFTTKFSAALTEAQSLAIGADQQFIDPLHLMLALLDQEGGGTRPLLSHAGVNVGRLRERVVDAIDRLPSVQGTEGDVQVSNDLVDWNTLTASQLSADPHPSLGVDFEEVVYESDDSISTEPLLYLRIQVN